MSEGISLSIDAAPFGQTQNTWPAQAGQGFWFFWPLMALVAGRGLGVQAGLWSADSAIITQGAVAIMLLGGLPHGACDLSLAAAALQRGWRELGLVLVLYVLTGAAMAGLWWLSPIAALIVFLALSGFHFGEDWAMLPSGLLRVMAGLAVITTAAIGQPAQVSALFVGLTGSSLAPIVAHWLAAAAPVTLLVTAVGLTSAWQAGLRLLVLAYGLSYAGLLFLPPMLGFALFFVGLHAPLHWRTVIRHLPGRQILIARREAIGFTALTLAVWLVWLAGWGLPMGGSLGAEAFRLLSIVAAPHLALSLALERRLKCGVPVLEG